MTTEQRISALETNMEQMATKSALEELRAEMNARFDGVQNQMAGMLVTLQAIVDRMDKHWGVDQ